MKAPLQYTSFLIRLWREPAVEDDFGMGIVLTIQVEHIPNGEKRYFSSLEELCAYLRECEGVPPTYGNEETEK